MPAPTVLLVSRLTRMKPPVSWFTVYGSKATGRSNARLTTPISFSSSFLAARCSIVLTFTLYFGSVTVADTVCEPTFSR
jgi:hypothetical protein